MDSNFTKNSYSIVMPGVSRGKKCLLTSVDEVHEMIDHLRNNCDVPNDVVGKLESTLKSIVSRIITDAFENDHITNSPPVSSPSNHIPRHFTSIPSHQSMIERSRVSQPTTLPTIKEEMVDAEEVSPVRKMENEEIKSTTTLLEKKEQEEIQFSDTSCSEEVAHINSEYLPDLQRPNSPEESLECPQEEETVETDELSLNCTRSYEDLFGSDDDDVLQPTVIHPHLHHDSDGATRSTPIDSTPVTPKLGSSARGPEGANIFVGGLPDEFSDQDLCDVFSEFGQIISTKMVRQKPDNTPIGFGFVSFTHPEEAQKAIQKHNGQLLFDKQVTVRIAEHKDRVFSSPSTTLPLQAQAATAFVTTASPQHPAPAQAVPAVIVQPQMLPQPVIPSYYLQPVPQVTMIPNSAEYVSMVPTMAHFPPAQQQVATQMSYVNFAR